MRLMRQLLLLILAAGTAAAQTTVTSPSQQITIPAASAALPAGVTAKNGVWTFLNPPVVPGLIMGTQPVVSTSGLAAGSYVVTVAASGAASYSPLPAQTGFLVQNCNAGVCSWAVVPFPVGCTGALGWAGRAFPCMSGAAAELRGPGTPEPLPPPSTRLVINIPDSENAICRVKMDKPVSVEDLARCSEWE